MPADLPRNELSHERRLRAEVFRLLLEAYEERFGPLMLPKALVASSTAVPAPPQQQAAEERQA